MGCQCMRMSDHRAQTKHSFELNVPETDPINAFVTVTNCVATGVFSWELNYTN